eukprot:g3290.t1
MLVLTERFVVIIYMTNVKVSNLNRLIAFHLGFHPTSPLSFAEKAQKRPKLSALELITSLNHARQTLQSQHS